MSFILHFWLVTFTVLVLLFVGAFLIDTFNDVVRQIKEFFHE